MQNSKIFTFLRKLSKKECDDFYKYLVQTKGDQHEWTRVFAYLKKFQPDYQDSQKLDMAYVCRVVFGKVWAERQNARRDMLNILSFLNGELKTFLLSERLKQTEDMKMLLWLEILRERGLTEELAKQTTFFYETTQKSDKTSLKSYFQEMAANFLQYQNLTASETYDDFHALRGFLDAWEAAAAVIHTKMACDLVDRIQVLAPMGSIQKATESVVPLLAHQERSSLSFYPYAELCREAYQLATTGKEEYYVRMEALFFAHAAALEKNEAHWFAKCMKNYIAKQVRRRYKQAEFAHKLYALDKLGWDIGLFSEATDLRPTEFVNIVATAGAYKDFGWAKNFIQKHADVLSEKHKENAVALAHAALASEEGDYQKVIALIAQKKFEDWRDHIRSKILLLRASFELGHDSDTLQKMCSNFERQLHSSGHAELGATQTARWFLVVFKNLIKETVSKKKLLEQIEKSDLFMSSWLLEKAQIYKARYEKVKKT